MASVLYKWFLWSCLLVTCTSPAPLLNKDCVDVASEQSASEDEGAHHEDVFSQILKSNNGTTKNLWQGDIATESWRSATKCTSCLWPKSADGAVRVPYRLSSAYSDSEKSFIRDALLEFNTLTCVHLVERSTEEDFLDIVSDIGCWSYIGRFGGAQPLSLMSSGCLSRGVIQHEVDHALGFYHEQSRSDRDTYIDVLWQYIQESDWSSFEMVDTDNLDFSYDYSSVMHYGWYAFSNTSGQPSLRPKPDPTVNIGQRYGLSQLDVSKVKELYGCKLCTYLLTGVNGSLDSHSFVSDHPSETNCLWLIRVNKNKALLHFDAFNLSPSGGCSDNYIMVYDGPSRSSPVLVERACGSLELPLLVASGGVLLVEFVHERGLRASEIEFSAFYSSVDCGGTYINDNGTVTSPGYPNPYTNLVHCMTTIWAPPGYQIVLNFMVFVVEYSFSCSYDYLLINDGSRPSSPELGRFCSDTKIPTIVSTGNVLLLQFRSDHWMNDLGYSADYHFVPAV
ncbi:astacin-like metalloendopeptidase [Xenopus laevis]|uniref:Metalloendopeptidase n=1 Tax=Xenopus laevis TaxID=8355 RepID=A0A8J0UZM5_XENLA|nr:astacin-like metalloendopeptidase [Xenopus laevis]